MSTYTSIVLQSETTGLEHQVEVLRPPAVLPVAVGILTIFKGTLISGGPWKIALDSVAEIRQEGSNFVAVHHDVDEYGIGKTIEDAAADLLASLLDYHTSLEKREKRLAAKEAGDLARLRKLLGK